MGWIQEVIGHLGDIINKAHLFDNEVKTEGHLSAQKIITILVKYGHKMETILEEMRKLLPKPSVAAGSSQPLVLAAKSQPQKEAMHQLFKELEDRLQQRKVQEAITTAVRIEVPVLGMRLAKLPMPSAVLVASPTAKEKKTKKEPESRAASFEPSFWKQDSRKKVKEPMPEKEESTAKDIGSSEGDAEAKEEPSTPPPEPAARMGLRSTDKKKPHPIYRSSATQKQPTKTLQKGEGSNKKPRGK